MNAQASPFERAAEPRPGKRPRSRKSNSPFRYPGGKFYARRLVLDVIPPHESYCEPFAGEAPRAIERGDS